MKFLQWPYTIFFNDSFFFKFPISRENRNLEPITIRFDVGHPVSLVCDLLFLELLSTNFKGAKKTDHVASEEWGVY